MKRIISPLRYPGSKALLCDYFEAFIQENLLVGCTLYEFYAGSAIISFEMLRRGVIDKAVLVERDPLLYSFWRAVRDKNEELCSRISRVRVTLRTWKRICQLRAVKTPTESQIMDLALACLFLNRTNFSGVLHAKPIGGMNQDSRYKLDCRFNKRRIIELIRNYKDLAARCDIKFGDALTVLRRYEKKMEREPSLAYFDPPYYVQGKKLYTYYYSQVQHAKLAGVVSELRMPWLVSIDAVPPVMRLYKGQKVLPIMFDYVIKQSRTAREYLFSNVHLPKPEYIVLGEDKGVRLQRSATA